MVEEGANFEFRDLEGMAFAGVRRVLGSREELHPLLEELRKRLGEAIAGPPMALYQWGTEEKGLVAEVGYPVSQEVDDGEISTRDLPPRRAAIVMHRGPLDEARSTYFPVYEASFERGLVFESATREVYHELDVEDPAGNLVEAQLLLHDWSGLLAKGVEEVLGPEAREAVMEGVDAITEGSPLEERLAWVKAAMDRIDGLADEEQKYWAVSRCADVYPGLRIQRLRGVWERTHDVDEVLRAMEPDTGWYSKPRREGNVIYHPKVPFDREAWEGATDPAERRRHFCHCGLVRGSMDEVDMSPTYCYCGTGWVRQLWEGILGRPVRVELLRSVVRGDEVCEFKIHLPI